MTLDDLYPAIENRNWYALVAFAVWAVIVAWKKFAPELYARIPVGWRWVPPVGLAVLTGFVDGYTSGLPWKQSVVRALWALLTIGFGAMGTHAVFKEAPGPYGGGKGGGKGEKLREDPIPESEDPESSKEKS